MQEKMDEFNEMLLRNTALTFSTEGITRDLKSLLARKSQFVAQSADAAARLSAAPCKSSARSKSIDELVSHIVEEIRGTNATINFVIMKVIERDRAMSFEAEESQPKPKHKKRATKKGGSKGSRRGSQTQGDGDDGK